MSDPQQKDSKHSVKVVGPNKEFVSYTHPARARSLLSRGKAFILTTNPFTIQMKGRIMNGDNSERKDAMQNQKRSYVSFTELFREEKDLWVQNISKTQISLQFMTSPGVYVGRCLPRTRKPINLSQFVSFDAIKNSNDLKTILNRRPAKLQILTEEEAMNVFKELAKANDTSMEEELEKAFEEQTMLMDHIVPESSEHVSKEHDLKGMKQVAANMGNLPEEEDDTEDMVTPRVVGLLEQAADDAPDGEKISVRALKEELEVIQDELTRADIEYIMIHAPKSIKKWAANMKDSSED